MRSQTQIKRRITRSYILAQYYTGLAVGAPRGVSTPTPPQISLANSWKMHVERGPGPPAVAGSFRSPTITDATADGRGRAVQMTSGRNVPCGEGGSEVMAWEIGATASLR